MGRHFFMLVCMTCFAGSLFSQKNESDSLFVKYLSDTTHAAEKIKEINKTAWILRGYENADAILPMYQTALALEPYAQNSPEILFRLHADFAGYLHSVGSLEFAMENWKKALSIYRAYHPDASAESCNIMGSMVGYYISSKQYDSAFYYYDLALNESKRSGIYLLISSAYNNIGMLKTTVGDYQAAHQYYDQALANIKGTKHDDIALQASIYDNLAALAIAEKQWDTANDYYNRNIDSFKNETGEESRLFNSYCGIIRVLNLRGNYSEAENKLVFVDEFFPRARKKLNDGNVVAYYNLHMENALGLHELDKVEYYHNRISSFKDSINNVTKKLTDPLAKAMINITMIKFDKDLELFRLQLSEKERDLKEARRKEFLNFGIAVATVVCSIFIYLFFRNRSRLQKNEIRLQQYRNELAEKELQNKMLEQEKTERELHHKKSDLRDVGIYLGRLRHLHQTMSGKLGTLRNQKSDEIKKAVSDLVHEWDSELYSQQHLQLIQENIELVNSEFYTNLTKTFPSLTKSEVELCGLLKLNLSSKEISIMKGISQESVKMARYRLRKKLKLNPEDDIYQSLAVF